MRRHLPMASRLPEKSLTASLGQHASRGLLWTLLQSISSKLVGMAGQLALAVFLFKEDFGLIGLSYTVTAFITLLTEPGLRIVLVQRQRRMHLWSGPAFWMTVVLGIGGALLTISLAPLVASPLVYDEPRLVLLLQVLAISIPLGALGAVPSACLSASLRFKAIAISDLLSIVGTMGLSVYLAWQGWGPMSVILPRPIINGLHTAALWVLAKPRVSRRPQIRRWRYLLDDTSLVFGMQFMRRIIDQSHYIVLGLFHDKTIVGIYYFGYALSLQVVQLIGLNLGKVLFPVFSQITKDPQRQIRGYIQSQHATCLLGTPLALLQTITAAPLIHAIYGDKWNASIPVVQILSAASAMRLLSMGGASILQAQRHFKANFILTTAYALSMLAFSILGASLGEATMVALFTGAFLLIGGPLHMAIVLRTVGHSTRPVLSVVAAPTLLSAAAAAIAWTTAQALPPWPGIDWIQIALMTLIMLGVYIPLVRWWQPQTYWSIVSRLKQALKRSPQSPVEPVVEN